MNGQYILVGKEAKPVDDIIEWAKSYKNNRVVEQTEIGEVKISTVFLALDHSFDGGKPLLFETMIFGGNEDMYCDRYTTWDEAVEGHKKAVSLVNTVV